MGVWFITGASRGFGAAIAGEAYARGHQVVATARNSHNIADSIDDPTRFLRLPMDVTDPPGIDAAVRAALATFGRIDVLVNNAGRGLLSAVEESSDEEVRALYETNVFGVLNVQRVVLPVLRGQRAGHVINIGSLGGVVTAPGWGIYCSTKFAMEGYSEAMAAELAPLGIKVTIVEPGYFQTDFLHETSLTHGHTAIADYASGMAAVRDRAAQANRAQPGDPQRAAAAIVDLTEQRQPPVRLPLGADSVAAIQTKLQALDKGLREARAVAESTDFAPAPDAAAPGTEFTPALGRHCAD